MWLRLFALTVLTISLDSPSVQSPAQLPPRFGAGDYELVLHRGAPIRDDSLRAKARLDASRDWSRLNAARTRRDSQRVLRDMMSDDGHEGVSALASATTIRDSARIFGDYLKEVACFDWLSGGTLTVGTNGSLRQSFFIRQYCRGRRPAYSSRTYTVNEDSLLSCANWEPPVQSAILHLTCRDGTYLDRGTGTPGGHEKGFTHVGDTLLLRRDCDGRHTYVLRRPPPAVRPSGGLLVDLSGC
jgi:hypothetical protein